MNARVRDIHAAVFRALFVKCRVADAVFTAKLLRPKPALVLFQYPDDVFFAESTARHRPSPSRNGLYLKIEGTFGGKGISYETDRV